MSPEHSVNERLYQIMFGLTAFFGAMLIAMVAWFGSQILSSQKELANDQRSMSIRLTRVETKLELAVKGEP